MPKETSTYHLKVFHKLSDIPAADWNRLNSSGNPFLSHEFLNLLEVHDCLSHQGWQPCHYVLFQKNKMVAATPLYKRNDSYGEFVFDWAWADAYQQSGRNYYPKLVSAIPFTPVIGERILTDPDSAGSEELFNIMLQHILQNQLSQNLSSSHFLFCQQNLDKCHTDIALLPRLTWQYHWHNKNYKCFDEFLLTLNSKRRKQIRKERREIQNNNLTIEKIYGDEITEQQWRDFYQFYCSTFQRKWGEPRLTLAFFLSLSKIMPSNIILIMAKLDGNYIAGAFTVRSKDTLYGRHWGCSEFIPNLHFECCYYQTIDLCIEHGISKLDAGIQGEHKIFRGFEPVLCKSYHAISDPGFRKAIEGFLKQETSHIKQQVDLLNQHKAYKL